MPELKYKNFGLKMLDFKIASEDEKVARVRAYVSIFNNIDRANEMIIKGAFEQSLAKKLPKVVWSHDWQQPIGKVITAVEDEKGLLVEFEILKTIQKGAEAIELLKAGAVDEFSIGYNVEDYEFKTINGIEVVVLKKLELFEVSPVLVGCNPDTELLSIKGLGTKTIKDINFKDGKVEIVFDADEKMLFNIDDSLKTKFTLSTDDTKGVKVDTNEAKKRKIVLIRKTLKQIAKSNEYLLKITKERE